jgi:TonB family protein
MIASLVARKVDTMKTLYLQLVLPAILVVFSSSCTFMEMGSPTDESEVFTRPEPEFPQSERQRGREGWVLIAYSVGRSGIVDDLYVRESSGNSKFEEAALNGVRDWRFVPGEQRELSVLVSFVDDQDETPLSQKFYTLHQQTNELIDEGELERAHELLAEVREEDDLHPSELAYSFLTEGRIANERGDRAEQLHYYRKAMLDNGRWLARADYLGVLYVAVVLELNQGDFVTAIRDYELLTETRSGRKLGADLEDLVLAARARIDADPSVMQPYTVADNSVTVLRVQRLQPSDTFGRGSGSTDRHGFSKPSKQSSGSKKD